MVCYLSATIGTVDFGPETCKSLLGFQDIRVFTSASQGVDVGVFEQEEKIGQRSVDYLPVEPSLEFQGACVLDGAERDDETLILIKAARTPGRPFDKLRVSVFPFVVSLSNHESSILSISPCLCPRPRAGA